MSLAQTLHVDASISDVWRDLAAGRIGEAEAEHRVAALAAQRPVSRPANSYSSLRPISGASAIRRFKPRRYQRSPDKRESRRRRRMLACRADMPPSVGSRYTEGERAVLTVIAAEVSDHGYCDLHVYTIASKAGVSRSTVNNARNQAIGFCDIG